MRDTFLTVCLRNNFCRYNSLSCSHRAASKAVGAAIAAERRGEALGETGSRAGALSEMKRQNKAMGERIAVLQLQLAQVEQQRNRQLVIALAEVQQQQQQQHQHQQQHLTWYTKAKANGFRSNPLRMPDRLNAQGVSICRPHNYRFMSHVTCHTTDAARDSCGAGRMLVFAMKLAGAVT